MPTKNTCFALVRGRAMRVTRLDGCGSPVPGPDSSITTDGFVSVALTANTEEGEAISVTNAAGKICVSDEPCPTFTGYSVEIEFCGVNPALFSMLTGQDVITDGAADPTIIGFTMNSGIDACDSGFALELWSSVPVAQCEPGAASGGQYGYFLIPFLRGGVLGDFTLENAAVTFTLSGATSKDGSTWGSGPYDVQGDPTTGLPGPLVQPVDDQDHLVVMVTSVPPPDPACDPNELGVPSTGASSGTPGAWTPANSYPPETLADATGLTATPSTAWVSGEFVTLGDGSTAHWDGTAWVAGVAP